MGTVTVEMDDAELRAYQESISRREDHPTEATLSANMTWMCELINTIGDDGAFKFEKLALRDAIEGHEYWTRQVAIRSHCESLTAMSTGKITLDMLDGEIVSLD
jgi:hypothetical protein